MADGTLRDFPNVPASAKVNVDGQQLGVHELQPGMKLQRTTVTSTTPQVVTTIQTVTGKVWHVTPPLSVILTLENGENQAFNIPDGQKFMVAGQETDAWGLKKGMNGDRNEDHGDSGDCCVAAHAGDRNIAAGCDRVDR